MNYYKLNLFEVLIAHMLNCDEHCQYLVVVVVVVVVIY